MCLASKCVWETQHVKCVCKGEVCSKTHYVFDLLQFSIAVSERGTAMDAGIQMERISEKNNTQNCSTNQPFTITNLYKYNEL